MQDQPESTAPEPAAPDAAAAPKVERNEKGRWVKGGGSPNPGGRKGKLAWTTEQRLKLRQCVDGVFGALYKAALHGDAAASKVLLERVLPPARHDDPVAFKVKGSLAEQARVILAMVASGDIGTSTGTELMNMVSTATKIAEVAELQARVEALEAASKGTP